MKLTTDYERNKHEKKEQNIFDIECYCHSLARRILQHGSLVESFLTNNFLKFILLKKMNSTKTL